MDEISWEHYIDRIIRDAMDEGKFEGLRGEGTPLPREEENPFADNDRRLAHHLLKSNGFTLPWIARRQEIQAQRERIAIPLKRNWDLYQARVSFRPDDAFAHDLWQRAQARFRDDVAALNKQIDAYNLMVPSDSFRLLPLNPESELARAVEGGKAKES